MRGLNAPPRSREAPGGLDALGAVGDLLLALDAAGACDDGKVAAADLHASTSMTLSSGWNLRLAFL